MDLSLYLKIVKFNFLVYLTYPLEIAAYIAKYFVRIVFLFVFWNIVAQGAKYEIDTKELFSYFLLTTSISDILMNDNTNLGRTIRKAVLRNNISQVLIKPVRLIGFFYAQTIGMFSLRLILSCISLIIGLILNPPQNLVSIFLFILFIIEAFFISFSYNLFEGALSFVLTEVTGIKNTMHHITRVLSGQLVPLSFFPETIKNILLLTPIPIMAYTPVTAL